MCDSGVEVMRLSRFLNCGRKFPTQGPASIIVGQSRRRPPPNPLTGGSHGGKLAPKGF